MANLLKTADKPISLNLNVAMMKYLRTLIRTGLYGPSYPQAVEELLRQRITQLIEADKLKILDEELTADSESG